jgi:hypothetical protein
VLLGRNDCNVGSFMLYLSNNLLKISILHPENDIQYLGSRYCRGGYIWQVDSVAHGPLFSGPSFPDSHPSVFDGQGIPDVFETAIGSTVSKVGECVHVIGVGDVLRTSDILPFHVRWNPTVVAPCQWRVVQASDFIEMSTPAEFKGHRYYLTKSVMLDNSDCTIKASLHNTGTVPIPVRWFVHPFFPLNNGNVFCDLSLPLVIPENLGFECNNNQITMVKTFDWKKGCYRTVSVPWDRPISVSVKHPVVKCVTMKTSYGLSWLPVWANENTFSIEPFFSKFLVPGESAEWSIAFTFSEV